MNRTLNVCMAGVLLATPAWAGATVETVKSPVSINHGQGYQQVTKTASVANGDQVMAGAGGHAKIVYADGCVTDVYPGGVASVGKCYKPMMAGLEVPPPAAYHVPWVPIVLGAAVIGVGVCAVSGCFENHGHGAEASKEPLIRGSTAPYCRHYLDACLKWVVAAGFTPSERR